MRRSLALVVFVCTTAVASIAWAVPPRSGGTTSADDGSWRALFDEGRHAHEQGRYEDAAEAFYRAREAGGPASLLYNQGLCLDRLERYDAAISVYQQYLDASPTAANRAEVEARIVELRQAAAQASDIESGGSGLATRIAPPSGLVMQLTPLDGGFQQVIVGEGRPVAHRDDGPRVEEVGPEIVVSWFLLAGTLASVGAAIGVGLDGQATFDRLDATCRELMGCTEDEIASSSAHVSETVTNVLIVTSALLGAATLISFLVEGSSGGTRVYVDLAPGGASLRGTF